MKRIIWIVIAALLVACTALKGDQGVKGVHDALRTHCRSIQALAEGSGLERYIDMYYKTFHPFTECSLLRSAAAGHDTNEVSE
ncbi:hypothetical protein M8623_003348 [Salmonella enterica subsp. enterica]|nr:hypothetical protein [Salmonella enterica subsp. enterica]